MHRSALLIALIVVVVALPTVADVASPATAPSTRPALVPPKDAATLANHLGRIKALTVRYGRWNDDDYEYWDVVVTDRTVLARVEAMRRSDFSGQFLFDRSYAVTARLGGLKFTGPLGWIKRTDRPYAMRLRGPDGRWSLFIETDEAAEELDRLITAEALRQRPEYPMAEQRS